MSIERLNKAATAAGYAMATPDDDVAVEERLTEAAEEPASRAVVVSNSPARQATTGESITRLTGWLKGYLPGMGWRAHA